jgi:hypothetical protein
MDPLDMLNEFINDKLFPEGCPPIEWLNDEELISLCSFPGEERDLDHVDRYASTYQFELDTLAKEAYLERDRRLQAEAAAGSLSPEEAAAGSFSSEEAAGSLSPEAAAGSFSPEAAVGSLSPEEAVGSFSPETVTESSHPNAFDGVTDMEIDVPVDPLPSKVSVESIVFMTSKLVLEKTDKRSLKESHNIFAKNAYCLYAEQLLRLIQNEPTPYFQFDEALHNRTSVDDVMDTTSTLRKCLAENNIELQSVRRVSKVKEEIAKDKHELLFMCRISTSFKHKKIRSPLTEVDTNEIHLVLLTDGILYSHFLVASDTLSFFTLRKTNLKTVTFSLGELPECPEVEANILIQNIIRTFDVIR